MLSLVIWAISLLVCSALGFKMGETASERIYIAVCLQFAMTLLIVGTAIVTQAL